MRSYALILLLFLSFASCRSAKQRKIVTKKEAPSKSIENNIAKENYRECLCLQWRAL